MSAPARTTRHQGLIGHRVGGPQDWVCRGDAGKDLRIPSGRARRYTRRYLEALRRTRESTLGP